MRRVIGSLACALAVGGMSVYAENEAPVRWDLSEIYAGDEQWESARGELAGAAAELNAFRGKLGESAETLERALAARFRVQMLGSRLAAYAGMRADEDTRESGPQGMRQSLQNVFADVTAATAWIEPELLGLDPERLNGFVSGRPGLADYARFLERLEKRRPHVLAEEQEKLLGLSQRIRGVGSTVGGLLRNAEMPWQTVTLQDGSELTVDIAGYSRGRQAPLRADRQKTFRAFYDQLQAFKGSLAATLSATVQEHVFVTRARAYESCLEAALAANEVDPAVYRMLVKEINAALPTLHRYFELRGRILGIDDLKYHDIYPPLVDDVGAEYDWETSKRLMGEALAPLGEQYVERLLQALNGGWVDVYPRPGKRSGAYVNDGAYEVHPYMLLNHQDDYSSASTAAHEVGHLMHSWFSQEALPYPTAGYSIFVAEVASTVNEVIFFKHLLAQAENDDERLALLGAFLEGMRGTVFRQTMFAEFELAIHEAAEAGRPLTGDSLNALYGRLLRKYHGHDDGVLEIDPHYHAEWAFIPHFHYNFYVYQYATSYVAATALAEGIMERRPGALERYRAFLRSGSTKPPVDLLRDAGVDMTTADPIHAAMRLMNEVMDRIDEILERRAGRRG